MYLTHKPIDLETFFLEAPDAASGALVTFQGVVRNHHEGRNVEKIYYDCYPSMAEKEIRSIITQIQKTWPVHHVKLVHRVGWLGVGETALAVWVAASHRLEAFSACRELIDEVKRRVPIWKKEVFADGTSEWVLGPEAVKECLR